MAKRTIRVSDHSGKEIPEGKGAVLRVTFRDARKSSMEMDVLDEEVTEIVKGGRVTSRRGRRPKTASA